MAIVDLIYNFGLFLALMLSFGYLDSLIALPRRARLLVAGVGAGVIALITMLVPVRLNEQFFVDGRLMAIAIVTVFVHPLSGAIAAGIALVGRFLIGGAGVPAGMFIIIAAYGVSYGFRRWLGDNLLHAPTYIWFLFGFLLLVSQAPAYFLISREYIGDIIAIIPSYTLFYLVAPPFLALVSVRELRQRDAQNALMEREYFIQRIAEATPNPLYIYDLTTQRNIYASKEIVSILGYTPQELHKLPSGGVLELMHPDDVPKAVKHQEEEVMRLKDNEVSEQSFRMRHRDGTWHWLTVREVVFSRDDKGRPTQILGIASDTTEQKVSEERLRYQANLLDNVSDAIISIDNEYRVTTWNRAAERIYGWRAEEVLGRPIGDILQPIYFDETVERVLEQFRAQGYWEGETSQLRKDGVRRIIYVHTTALYDPNGIQIGAVSINRDITDIKQANIRQLEMAVQKEKIAFLRQFISDASHDFRTPLATIHTSLYLLGRLQDPEQRQRHLERIARQTTHIQSLVEDMLTLVRLDADGIPLLESVDLSKLLADLVNQTRPQLAPKGLTLNVDIAPDLPSIRGSISELLLCFTKVMDNALQYTQQGGTISLHALQQGGEVLISIQDNGVGIAPQDLPRIFDRFFRADSARSTETGGAGLGLAIAQKIVELHSGRIVAESQLSVGTTMSIYLPTER